MHILAPQAGRIDDGEDAVDLGQSPGDILILSAADSELSALSASEALRQRRDLSLRLVNLMALNHPYSVDLYVEQTARHAKVIIVRVLGGIEYWRYGLEQLQRLSRGFGVKLFVMPGDDKWDESLASLSSEPVAEVRRAWRYFVEGGQENLVHLMDFASICFDGAADTVPFPSPLPRVGIYSAGKSYSGDEGINCYLEETTALANRPVVPILFYRSYVQSAMTAPIDDLCDGLRDLGLHPLALFVPSLKDSEAQEFLQQVFLSLKPDVFLNCTAFALSKAGGAPEPTFLDGYDCPVLQVMLSGSSQQAWEESPRGLSARDLAMHVVLPELDGRILSRAIAFKEEGELDAATEYKPVTLVPHQNRIAFVAAQAHAWATLRVTAPDKRKIALVLANYPNKDSRIANGVGLDSPASVVGLMKTLIAEGYCVDGAPEDSDALMTQILAGPTNADGSANRKSAFSLLVNEYEAFFKTLPETVRDAISERWGDASSDPMVREGAFQLPILSFGNLVVGVQPARGYNIDPKETYHDPDLVPPHNYFAFYFWLRERFGIHAVVHAGKHGNLEWLPGKALALSDACYPEAVLGPVPHLYPFIVNDPGEGCQAKRRTSAVIIDHLTPPLTRAEAHGAGEELEALVDEFYTAQGVDPRRSAKLLDEIRFLASRTGLDKDAGVASDDSDDQALQQLDAHLCDIKELQIRDGLHILGQSPTDGLLVDLLVSIARVPRGGGSGDASLHRAIASDLDLILANEMFDPIDCDFAKVWTGPRPTELAAVSDAPWRHCGDTVERIEILARKLVSKDMTCPDGWQKTCAVLDWIAEDLRPTIKACGSEEFGNLLKGLSGRFVPPGPSGAPTRGRPDVLPTGRNFFAVDVRSVPSKTAWAIGELSAQRLVERHYQDEGEWLQAIALTCWGTANMRTGGDDIAQALALLGVRPVWEPQSGRVTGIEVLKLSELQRPRVDVTLRISGFFRDAFPHQIDLFDSAVRQVAALEEPDDANPIAARVRTERRDAEEQGLDADLAERKATFRVFGSMPGAYGAGLQALIDEKIWDNRSDFAEAFVAWGGFAYGAGQYGDRAAESLKTRLSKVDAVVQNQDNREHDILDSDDYYQFEGGLAASVEALKGTAPKVYHNDHSRAERPVIRTLDEEIARVVRGRAANPKWIAGVMRHGYKGAFEMAATLDYLFAFAATTNAVGDHHFDQLYEAYIKDDDVADFLKEKNRPAYDDMVDRFLEAIERGLWTPRSNSAAFHLNQNRSKRGDPQMEMLS
ncbi:cobaltochelatase CobN subunit [Cohaesibacter sp. ES.047]|uniref:cobaltochelatase subunit CobN n=1 Tax=Cohaesibacter sp. ES.047 TaxID=1798205 RepID=UPI000BB7EAF9|nr:cobaltochelatase subunit CobN [Cohaesibacter sp. ES.047]SNY93545.1 cobaltochelatase CobN subunit [Cohaesibacter sp. ES.047]